MHLASSTIVRLLTVVLLALVPSLAGCKKTYAQDTPENTLASAKQMVADGQARRLPDLIYADTPEMRTLWNQLGDALGSLQKLGTAVQSAYPDEIERLRQETEAAAKRGEATSLLQRISGQARQATRQSGGGGRQRGGPPSGPDAEAQTEQFNRLFRDLFANPYGFLDQQSTRLSVKQITDDTAAILIDNKPAFGVGLTMRLEDGKWYIALPLNVPPLSRVLPKSPEGWQILGDLMGVGAQMFDDLRADVEGGRAAKLDDLARLAGDKAFLPAAMVFIAYGNIMREERREQRDLARSSAQGTPPPPAK